MLSLYIGWLKLNLCQLYLEFQDFGIIFSFYVVGVSLGCHNQVDNFIWARESCRSFYGIRFLTWGIGLEVGKGEGHG